MKNFLSRKIIRPKNIFENFWDRNFQKHFGRFLKISKMLIFQCFSKISKIVRKFSENFDPKKFRKLFSDEEFFDLDNFSYFLVFSIRTVIENCFSLCLANIRNGPKVLRYHVLLKMWRVTAIYQFIRYRVKKRDF